jgi:hypothetical protein
MGQGVGVFGLLDFTMLQPVLAWRFETYEPFISLVFKFSFLGCGKVRISEIAGTESADMEARLYNMHNIMFFI